MNRRFIFTLISLVVVIGAIGFVKYRQIQAAIAQGASFQMPPEAVTTIVATEDRWQSSLGAIGTVAAVQGVVVSADLPGVVTTIAFDSGGRVAAGAVLVRLDTRQEEAQLEAAEAQQRLTALSFERTRGLRGKGVTSQAEYDRAEAEAQQAQARVAEIRATIERKTIRAPFAGVLGIRQVNKGQYLNGGDPVVSLQALDAVYVDFSLPQQSIATVHTGAGVEILLEGVSGVVATGKITAIDAHVDPATRNVHMQATFRNPDGRLRPGMFVDARVAVGESTPVLTLPASAISYAPYGNSVFIVEDVKGPTGETYRGVRQQFVRLGDARGDQVAILDGIKPGEEVVTSGVFKLRPGAAVQVHNDVQPGNDPAPKPEDS